MYNIILKNSIKKDLKRIDKKYINIILNSIELLKVNPFPLNSKKIISSEFYRIRVGDYRVIYFVDKNKFLITIFFIRHRNFDYNMFVL